MTYRSSVCALAFATLALSSAANAAAFRFDTDPFAGTNVRNTPGRQIVGGESFINFSVANDVFSLESAVFGVTGAVSFVNAAAPNLPASGVNIVVLESLDNDNNTLTPFGAGQAADLIAGRITTPGAGFFVYFNQTLDLPRLVYSTDLSSNTADLKILARMLNLNGADGRNALPTFAAANFEITTHDSPAPEPATAFLIVPVIGIGCLLRRKRFDV